MRCTSWKYYLDNLIVQTIFLHRLINISTLTKYEVNISTFKTLDSHCKPKRLFLVLTPSMSQSLTCFEPGVH